MADKKITDATTVETMGTTDKLFVNSGGDLKQIELDKAISASTPVQQLNNNIAFYNCFTKNFISESGCEGYGYNFAIYNNTAKVGRLKFTTKIESTSSDTSDFKFRYNINEVFNLFNLRFDTIKILGGTWQCYNAEGKIINKLTGYGACIRQSSGIIRLERYYKTDGSVGAWAASEFIKGYYLEGEFVFLL